MFSIELLKGIEFGSNIGRRITHRVFAII